MRAFSLLAIVGALLAAQGGTAAAATPTCRGADARPGTVSDARSRSATLCLINAQRRSRGLRPLRQNTPLRGAARRYSTEMVAQRFFAHESPSGSTLASRVRQTSYLDGARSYALGENLAWGQGALATPRNIVRGWMRSPGHRANILRAAYRDIGIGIAIGTPEGGDGATYTTAFGRRS